MIRPAFAPSALRRGRLAVKLVCIEQVHGAAGSSPYGLQQNLWSPAPTGRDFDLSPTSLKSLEPFREHLTIISNTDVPSADPTEAREIGGDHYPIERRVSDAVVSETHRRRGRRMRHLDGSAVRAALRPGHAAAVDAAVHRERRSVRRVRLRLLVRLHRHHQLGGAEQAAADDPRSARGLRSDVRRVRVRRLEPKSGAARRQEDLSILDWVRESAKRLERKLGACRSRAARAIISTTCARSSGASRRSRSATAAASRASCRRRRDGIPDSFAEHVRLMFDLQMLAFRSDITRVFSFKLGRDASNRVYPESGSTGAFHIVSHHGENPERVREFAKINAYHVGSMLPYLLKQLKETPDGDGTMLDNALVIYGSPMGNPNQHNHKRVPFLVAGHAGGAIKGGVHLKAKNGTPLSNVMLSLLHTLGLDDLQSFGDSEGTFSWE